MINLNFERLTLISMKERKARQFEFKPNSNLILGENHTGKSTLLKSLYWTLGAEPSRMPIEWQTMNVISLLETKNNADQRITFTRHAKQFRIYDSDKRMIFETNSISRQLSKWLADQFEISLKMTNRDGQQVNPPPAYLFMPFYVDQDKGWNGPWESFASLTQFSGWRDDVIKYHTGQRNNQFYKLKTEQQSAKATAAELENERLGLRAALERVRKSIGSVPIAFDRAEYERAITKLLSDINRVQVEREKTARKLAEASDELVVLNQQLAVARSALAEVDKDYSFAKSIYTEHVVCPTCGTEHDNDYQNRYALIETAEDYREFILNNEQRAIELSQKVSALKTEIGSSSRRIELIETALQSKRGKIKASDVIEAEGAKRARQILDAQLNEYTIQIQKLDDQIADAKKSIARNQSKSKIQAVVECFWKHYSSNLSKLAVFKVVETDTSRIPSSVRDTGSEQPRAVLAYVLAILSTLKQFSSVPTFPIVIDTPLQQDQDPDNAARIFSFISSYDFSPFQVFLGSVGTAGVDLSWNKLSLTREYSLLGQDEFKPLVEFAAAFEGLL